jgi:hypothetical protein
MRKTRCDIKPRSEKTDRHHDLPAAIRPGGIADQALRQAAENKTAHDWLRHMLWRDLELIRKEMETPSDSAQSCEPESLALYDAVLNRPEDSLYEDKDEDDGDYDEDDEDEDDGDETQDDEDEDHEDEEEDDEDEDQEDEVEIANDYKGGAAIDPVLRLCLAKHDGIRVRDGLYNYARRKYRANRDGYDEVLGDLIPPSLIAIVEENAYIRNANATALRDWHAFRRRLGTWSEQPQPGLITGFPTFDALTGGLRYTTLLAGPTGSGKTTLAQNLLLGVLNNDQSTGVLFISLEQSKDEFFTKLLSLVSGLEYRTLVSKDRSASQKAQLAKASDHLTANVLPRLRVLDRLNQKNTSPLAYQLRNLIIKFNKQPGIQNKLLIVDSVQELPVEPTMFVGSGGDQPQVRVLSDLEIDEAQVRVLVDLQRWTRNPRWPEGFPVLGVSRVNKNLHGRRLALDDVPGKSDIVHEVASVLFLEAAAQPGLDVNITPTILNIAKIRDGGQRGEVRFDFHHTVSRFQEATRADTRQRTGSSTAPDAQPGRAAGAERFAGKHRGIGGARS